MRHKRVPHTKPWHHHTKPLISTLLQLYVTIATTHLSSPRQEKADRRVRVTHFLWLTNTVWCSPSYSLHIPAEQKNSQFMRWLLDLSCCLFTCLSLHCLTFINTCNDHQPVDRRAATFTKNQAEQDSLWQAKTLNAVWSFNTWWVNIHRSSWHVSLFILSEISQSKLAVTQRENNAFLHFL